jgi:hypothetical protein
MAAFIATYPPLGQVTPLQESSTVAVHAVLEVPIELAGAPWQLTLWHVDNNGGEWTETQLLPSAPDARPTHLHQANEAVSQLYFAAELAVTSSLTFTVKYRQGAEESEWLWVRNEQGSDDGLVVVRQKPTRESDSEDLPDLVQDLNPDLKWRSHMSQTPGTRLWSVEAGVEGATGAKSAYANIPFGIPWGGFLR